MMQVVVVKSRKVNISPDFVDQDPAISKVPTGCMTALQMTELVMVT